MKFGVGQAVTRVEDQRLLTGAGRYTDDVNLPGQAYGYVVRSPHAHAQILSIDTEAAKVMPGVLGILTAADLDRLGLGPIPCIAPMKGADGKPAIQPAYQALAKDRVRFLGNAVAFVVAQSYSAARDAAEAVLVDYDPLPANVDTARALEPGAPRVHEEAPSNLALTWVNGDPAATAAAFAKAPRVARISLINNRVVVNSIEARGAIGDFDAKEGRYTLIGGNQGIFRLQMMFTQSILKVPSEKLRLVSPDVGGGFGMKIFSYPEQVMVLAAARLLGRPVKWISERIEAFQSDIQGRDHVSDAELAMDAQGHFLALRVKTTAAMGAYLSNFGPFIPTGASTPMFSGLYRIPAIASEVKCVFTNTVPVDAYRGAGRPEAAYLVERVVDEAARVMGLSQLEIRRRNLIKPEELPYDTKLARVYDSGNYPHLLEDAARRADWAGFAQRRKESEAKGKLRGIGVACYVEACSGFGDEEARIRLDSDGGVTLFIGTQTNGQGHHTAYAQMIHDKLAVPLEKVRMVQGDSDLIKRGGGTGGSRSLLMGGVAVNRASDKVIERVKEAASQLLEAAIADIEFKDGLARVVGTDRVMTLAGIAKAAAEGKLPDTKDGMLEEAGNYTAEALTYPNGCHVAEVEVDPETGVTKVLRYSVVDDFGTVVNPLLVKGQIMGGMAQGLGQALLERTVYDENSGQLITGSLMDYCLPRADDVPLLDIEFIQDYPCKTNPLGVKGAGEAGAIGAPPAIMNALMDALAPLGVKRLDMPATPEKVWRALQDAAKSRG